MSIFSPTSAPRGPFPGGAPRHPRGRPRCGRPLRAGRRRLRPLRRDHGPSLSLLLRYSPFSLAFFSSRQVIQNPAPPPCCIRDLAGPKVADSCLLGGRAPIAGGGPGHRHRVPQPTDRRRRLAHASVPTNSSSCGFVWFGFVTDNMRVFLVVLFASNFFCRSGLRP